jgi:hypothetical protein
MPPITVRNKRTGQVVTFEWNQPLPPQPADIELELRKMEPPRDLQPPTAAPANPTPHLPPASAEGERPLIDPVARDRAGLGDMYEGEGLLRGGLKLVRQFMDTPQTPYSPLGDEGAPLRRTPPIPGEDWPGETLPRQTAAQVRGFMGGAQESASRPGVALAAASVPVGGPVGAAMNAPFVASGVSRATDPNLSTVERVMGGVEAAGGGAGVLSGLSGWRSLFAGKGSPKPAPPTPIEEALAAKAAGKTDIELQSALTDQEKAFLKTKRDAAKAESQAASMKESEVAKARRILQEQERAHADANRMRGREALDAAKAETVAREQMPREVEKAHTMAQKLRQSEEAAAAKIREQEEAAARIAEARDGLEAQPPRVSESISAPIPGGKERMTISYKQPEAAEGGGGGAEVDEDLANAILDRIEAQRQPAQMDVPLAKSAKLAETDAGADALDEVLARTRGVGPDDAIPRVLPTGHGTLPAPEAFSEAERILAAQRGEPVLPESPADQLFRNMEPEPSVVPPPPAVLAQATPPAGATPEVPTPSVPSSQPAHFDPADEGGWIEAELRRIAELQGLEAGQPTVEAPATPSNLIRQLVGEAEPDYPGRFAAPPAEPHAGPQTPPQGRYLFPGEATPEALAEGVQRGTQARAGGTPFTPADLPSPDTRPADWLREQPWFQALSKEERARIYREAGGLNAEAKRLMPDAPGGGGTQPPFTGGPETGQSAIDILAPLTGGLSGGLAGGASGDTPQERLLYGILGATAGAAGGFGVAIGAARFGVGASKVKGDLPDSPRPSLGDETGAIGPDPRRVPARGAGIDPAVAGQLALYGGKGLAGSTAGASYANREGNATPGEIATGALVGGFGAMAIPTPALGRLPRTGGLPFLKAADRHRYEMMLTGAPQLTNIFGNAGSMGIAPALEAIRSGNTTPLRNLGRMLTNPRATAAKFGSGFAEGFRQKNIPMKVGMADEEIRALGPAGRLLNAMDVGTQNVMRELEIPEEMIQTYTFKNDPRTAMGGGIAQMLSKTPGRVFEPFFRTGLSLMEQGAAASPLRWLDFKGKGLRQVIPTTSKARDIAIAAPGAAAFGAGLMGVGGGSPTTNALTGPLSFPFSVGRGMHDYSQYDRDPGAFPAMRDATRAITNQIPFIASIPRLMESPERSVNQLGTQLVPQFLLMMGDKTVRDPGNIGESVMERLPGLREQLPVRHDFFGEPLQRNFFGQVPPPLYERDPRAAALAEMGLLRREQSPNLSGASLSGQEQSDLQRFRGQRMTNILDPFLTGQTRIADFPNVRDSVLEGVPEPRRTALRILMEESLGGSTPTSRADIFRQLQSLGVGLGTDEFRAERRRKAAEGLQGGQ